MNSYEFGDLVLLEFPFTDGTRAKRRPALVLLDPAHDSDFLVVRVTSKNPRTEFDVQIEGWESAGLLLPSVVRVDKIATLETSLVERKLGALHDSDAQRVKAVLNELLARVG